VRGVLGWMWVLVFVPLVACAPRFEINPDGFECRRAYTCDPDLVPKPYELTYQLGDRTRVVASAAPMVRIVPREGETCAGQVALERGDWSVGFGDRLVVGETGLRVASDLDVRWDLGSDESLVFGSLTVAIVEDDRLVLAAEHAWWCPTDFVRGHEAWPPDQASAADAGCAAGVLVITVAHEDGLVPEFPTVDGQSAPWVPDRDECLPMVDDFSFSEP